MTTKNTRIKTLYIIAEVASTHEGDIDYLIKLIPEISGIGTDAIKFQIYLADEIVEKGHTDYQDLLSWDLRMRNWINHKLILLFRLRKLLNLSIPILFISLIEVIAIRTIGRCLRPHV